MKSKKIKVFAPATIANVGPGFDIFGLALQNIGDTIEIKQKAESGIVINPIDGFPQLPTHPQRNVAGVAVQALLDQLEANSGFEITLTKSVMPGSGLGSSASSAAAAVFGVNELLGKPYTKQELIPFAMEGERASSGTAHADNVAPALLGGFAFIRSYDPLDVVNITPPADLFFTVIHPQVEVKTADSKKILRKEVSMKSAIQQWGNVAGFVTGLLNKDYDLIGRSMEDVIVEPVRSLLIPGYDQLKKVAEVAGALGCSISGSGPSVFAICRGQTSAKRVAQAFTQCYEQFNIDFKIYSSPINLEGAKILKK